MKRITIESDFQELAARVRSLSPEARRLWGRMTCPQMVCHLSDAFRAPLGDRPPSAQRGSWLLRTLVKWVILRTPLTWRSGAPTSPEIDQVAGAGTPPAQFADDVATLLALMKRFAEQADNERRPPHPLFGRLNASEWARWGWAHVDLHLRQFGA
jgi:uncharacterized protein DUF1569